MRKVPVRQYVAFTSLNRQIRIVSHHLAEAYDAMIRALQVIPDDELGAFAFRLNAVRVKRSIYEAWEDLDQLCVDWQLPHKVPPKRGK